MRVLVTGASGFIGSHLCEYLSSRPGIQVLGMDRSRNGKGVVESVVGDVRDREEVSLVLSGFDGVVHLAGILGTSELLVSPSESVEVNVLGALNIYDAVWKHGIPAVQITVGNYNWLNTYSITKLAAERMALMYNREHGTKISVVRGLNTYGPGQKHLPVRKVVPTFIVQALRNQPIEVFGDGEQEMDLIHVEDLCRVLGSALLLDHRSYYAVFEAGSGEAVTVNRLAELIRDLANSSSDIVHLPMRPGEPVKSRTVGDPRTLVPLGLDPKNFRSLEDGLEETIHWYCHNYPWSEEGG